MISDYENYTKSMCAILIKNGITDIENKYNTTQGYEKTIDLAQDMSQIYWYFTLMAKSDSPSQLLNTPFNLSYDSSTVLKNRIFSEYILYKKNISPLLSDRYPEKDYEEIEPDKSKKITEIVRPPESHTEAPDKPTISDHINTQIKEVHSTEAKSDPLELKSEDHLLQKEQAHLIEEISKDCGQKLIVSAIPKNKTETKQFKGMKKPVMRTTKQQPIRENIEEKKPIETEVVKKNIVLEINKEKDIEKEPDSFIEEQENTEDILDKINELQQEENDEWDFSELGVDSSDFVEESTHITQPVIRQDTKPLSKSGTMSVSQQTKPKEELAQIDIIDVDEVPTPTFGNFGKITVNDNKVYKTGANKPKPQPQPRTKTTKYLSDQKPVSNKNSEIFGEIELANRLQKGFNWFFNFVKRNW